MFILMTYKTKKKINLYLSGGSNSKKKIINKEKKDKKKAAKQAAKQARKNAEADKKKTIADKTKEQTKLKLQSRKGQLMDMLTDDIEAKFGKEYREGQVAKATKSGKGQGQGAQGQGAQGPGAQGAQGAKDGDKTKGAKKSLIFLWAVLFGAIVSFNLTKKEDRSTSNPF